MSQVVNIHDAKTHLSKLLERVLRGEEVVIAKAGKPVAKLVRIVEPVQQRTPGSAAGMIKLNEDFYEPLPEDVLEGFEK